LSRAVSARAVQLSESLDAERINLDGSSSIVLNDFVRGSFGASTNDVALSGAGGLLDGDGILTDILCSLRVRRKK